MQLAASVYVYIKRATLKNGEKMQSISCTNMLIYIKGYERANDITRFKAVRDFNA